MYRLNVGIQGPEKLFLHIPSAVDMTPSWLLRIWQRDGVGSPFGRWLPELLCIDGHHAVGLG